MDGWRGMYGACRKSQYLYNVIDLVSYICYNQTKHFLRKREVENMAFVFSCYDPQLEEISAQLHIDANLYVECHYQENAPLKVEKNCGNATITYGKRVELFRGLGLLAEHCQEETCSIEQRARFTMNGAMLDCSRNGVLNLDTVKQVIRYMALMGHNMLMLYTEDTYEVPEYPYFGYMRGRYTQQELRELDEYAYGYGIELIPCIQTLAHMAAALRWECFDDMKDTEDILLCDNEKTFHLIEAMIRACRNCFRSKRINIGMDEAFMLGLGQYREKNGMPDREQLFCRHLDKVNKICKRYEFKPMIWSDMFYRLACSGSYDADCTISEEVRDLVPAEVDLVYWEYDRYEKESYIKPLKSHLQFNNPIIFAGGAWRWLGYTPHIQKSQNGTRAALEACLETGVQEVICTAWADEGNEASIHTMLPTLQLYAEYSYQGNISDEALAKRLLACTGEDLSDMMLMDMPDRPDGQFRQVSTNPSCYLLYSDVLGSVFEKHCQPCYRENYASYAKKLWDAGKRSPNLGYAYDMLAELCHLLELKSCISAEAYSAYQAGDVEALRVMAEKTLPQILDRLEAFRNAVEIRWMKENKRSGYDVLDLRLGGVHNRVKSAIRQLRAYLAGRIDKIEELEDPRLPFSNKTEEAVAQDPVMCWGIRKHHFTPNRFFW